jgi:hypothetical protein
MSFLMEMFERKRSGLTRQQRTLQNVYLHRFYSSANRQSDLIKNYGIGWACSKQGETKFTPNILDVEPCGKKSCGRTSQP